MITSLLRQNGVATSFLRKNDVIIAPRIRWVAKNWENTGLKLRVEIYGNPLLLKLYETDGRAYWIHSLARPRAYNIVQIIYAFLVNERQSE